MTPQVLHNPSASLIFSNLGTEDLHALSLASMDVAERIKIFLGQKSLREVVGNSFADAVAFARANRLTHINLEGFANIATTELNALTANLDWEIESISLSSQFIGDEALEAIASRAPGLSGITLSNYLKDLTNPGFTAFTSRCRNLKKITLGQCPELNSSSLIAMAQNCPLLETLSIYKLSLSNEFLRVLAENCSTLKELSFQACHLESENRLYNLIVRNPNLEKLNIAHLEVSSQDLVNIINALAHPKEVVVCGCEISPNVITRMALKMPELRHLDLTQCTGVDDGIIEIATLAWPNLESIYLAYTNVTDRGILILAERCAQLKKVDFSALSSLSNWSVISFVRSHPHLVSLSIKFNGNITNDTAAAIAQECHQLRELDSPKTSITSDHIGFIAENCPDLEDLRIHSLSNSDLDKIARSCPNLKGLLVGNSHSLEGRCILNLLDRCSKLEYVTLWGAPPEAIDVSRYPHVSIYFE